MEWNGSPVCKRLSKKVNVSFFRFYFNRRINCISEDAVIADNTVCRSKVDDEIEKHGMSFVTADIYYGTRSK